MLTVPPTTKLWFAPAVDLRLGFDGPSNLVRSQLHADRDVQVPENRPLRLPP